MEVDWIREDDLAIVFGMEKPETEEAAKAKDRTVVDFILRRIRLLCCIYNVIVYTGMATELLPTSKCRVKRGMELLSFETGDGGGNGATSSSHHKNELRARHCAHEVEGIVVVATRAVQRCPLK